MQYRVSAVGERCVIQLCTDLTPRRGQKALQKVRLLVANWVSNVERHAEGYW